MAKILPHYEKNRTMATLWKTELKTIWQTRFNQDIDSFNDYLRGFGITREINTISNWLNNDQTIGPLRYNDTLGKIALLPVSRFYKDNLAEIVKAIELTYKSRREAGKSILEILKLVFSLTNLFLFTLSSLFKIVGSTIMPPFKIPA